MPQTYQQIQRQIETLQRQAEKLKQSEVAGVVERMKVAIAHYGLTAQQLGFGAGKAVSATEKKRVTKGAVGAPKHTESAAYADDNGNVWGGRGPRPRWLREAIAAGKPLEDFATSASSINAKASSKSKTAAKGKRRAKASYRDEAGHLWSGFGPKPVWLKAALAAGKELEEFREPTSK